MYSRINIQPTDLSLGVQLINILSAYRLLYECFYDLFSLVPIPNAVSFSLGRRTPIKLYNADRFATIFFFFIFPPLYSAVWRSIEIRLFFFFISRVRIEISF